LSFSEDLKTGKDVEAEVLGTIKKKHPTAFMVDGYCKAYDIFVPEVSKGIEVKYDEMSAETGNLVVEIKMNDKLSALSTTLAHYWIFVTTAVYIWIKPDRIKDCIIQNNLQMRTFTGAGDSKAKDAYLIKENLLRQYADLVNERVAA
jgi:hypothetical protein